MPTLAALGIGLDARGARRGAREFRAATESVKRSGREATQSVNRVDRGMERLGTTVAAMKSKLAAVFAVVAGGVVVRSAVRTIADFEEVMRTVQGVTGATDAQFKQLTDTARTLGATTRFSATEAGEGLLFLARAGFDVDEATAALPATLQLAQGGAIALGEAADFASNIVQQFNLTAAETGRVVDVLIQVSNRANTDVRQLAEAMKFAGPVAGALGISVEDTAAAVGILGNAGIQASLAGTGLRQTFLALVAPTHQAKEAIASLGLTMDDVNPEKVGIIEAFRRLGEAGAGVAEINAIVGRRAIGGALQVTKFRDQLRQLAEQADNAAGAGKRMADIMDDTIKGSFFGLRSAIQEAMLQLGEGGFGRALRVFLDTATDVVRVLVGMEEHVRGNTVLVKTLAAIFKGLGTSIAVLTGFRLASWLYSVTVALKAMTLAALSNPFTAIAAAVSLAIGALVALKDVTLDFGGEQRTVGSLVQSAWQGILDVLRPVGEIMRNVILPIFARLVKFLEPVRKALGGVISALAGAWLESVKMQWRLLVAVVEQSVNAINTILKALGLPTIIDSFSELRDWVVRSLIQMEFGINNWQRVVKLDLLIAAKAVVDFKDRVVHIFATVIPALLRFFLDNWRGIFTDMANIAKVSFTNIVNVVKDTWTLIKEIVSGDVGITEAFSRVGEIAGRNMLDGFKSSIDGAQWDALFATIQNVPQSALSKELGEKIFTQGSELLKDFQEFYKKRLAEIYGSGSEVGVGQTSTVISDMINRATDAITGLFGSAVKQIEDAKKQLEQHLKSRSEFLNQLTLLEMTPEERQLAEALQKINEREERMLSRAKSLGFGDDVLSRVRDAFETERERARAEFGKTPETVTDLAGSVEVSNRFRGLAAQFQSQQRPLNEIARQTKRTADGIDEQNKRAQRQQRDADAGRGDRANLTVPKG